jgi:hypothetical protein
MYNTLKHTATTKCVLLGCRLNLRFALFWDTMQLRMVVSYRRFGKTCRSHFEWPSSVLDPLRCYRYVVPKLDYVAVDFKGTSAKFGATFCHLMMSVSGL